MLDSLEPYRLYWSGYNGLKGLVKSPYLYVSAIITYSCGNYWEKAGTASAQTAIDVIPSLMAFSLGGMAIVLALSNPRLLKAITKGGNPKSLFMNLIGNFFHFIIIQTIALIAALLVFSFPDPIWLSGISFFFLTYSVLTALATAAALFNISRIINVV